MSTEVTICNLALARLGDEANVQTISPPDGSAQASQCAQFYPVARDTLLTMRPWSFATVRTALAPLVPDGVHTSWAQAYAMPANCLLMRKVLEPDAADDVGVAGVAAGREFRVEAREDGQVVVLTNTVGAVGVFTKRITDVAKFSPLFSDALAWLLASYLAGPIVKGDAGRAAALRAQEAFSATMSAAGGTDASQQKLPDRVLASWLAARG
jgi:hypothetical protein